MSFWSELLLFVHRLVGGADREGDPRAVVEHAYRQQLELQAKMRRAVADVVTARKRIELQARQLDAASGRLEEQARLALDAAHHDAAREALTRRAVVREELDELGRQTAALAGEETALVAASKRLDIRIQQLRVRREALSASYAAARARAELGEALAGLSRQDADLTLALEHAEQQIAVTRARARALEAGSPLDPSRAEAEAARELARIEEELLWGPGQALTDGDER